MEKNKNLSLFISRTAIIASLYAVLTLAAMPLAFGALQLRLAEVLTLLCFYNKKHCPALILGCFIANLFSPFGWIDWIAGTSATALSVIPMSKIKNIWISSLLPVVVNAVIIGIELTYLLDTPLLFNMGYVALGQFIVIVIIGVPLFKFGFEKNRRVLRLIRSS